MRFNWQRDTERYANGVHVAVGRLGKLHVWYDGMRPKDDPTPYAASVFGRRRPSNFETEDEAKAWCEKWGELLLQEAAADVGCNLVPTPLEA